MDGPRVLILAVIAGIAYLVSRKSAAGTSSTSTNFQAKDPYTAAAQALTPAIQSGASAVVSQLQDQDSDLRRRLAQHGDNVTNIGHMLGLTQAAGQRKKDAQRFWNAEFATRLDGEKYAARVHTYLSRSDVEQWVIDEQGVLWIYFRGKKAPFKLEVPGSTAQYNRITFAAEPIVRALGTFIQRGRRIGTPFVRHDPPAFDDRNPFATPSMTVSGVAARERDPLTINYKAEQLGAALTPRSQAVLRSQGYLKQNLIPGQEQTS